ncbi:MAG: hypothetical protein VX473_07395 [Candidatus Thermoplasmatota archaeon]|nr:hypothetical protein [Candidatus Thermoplasmatota archaeon]
MPLVDDSMDESTPWLIEKLVERFSTTNSGFILDGESGNSPVWCIHLSAFERWFSVLESVTDQTLGRRLAYASAETEERQRELSDALPKSWMGQQKKRISAVNLDWSLRGLGQLAMLETTSEGGTLLVANRAHTALAAGMGNAAWECIQEQRYKFQWSDRGAGETVIQFTPDSRDIPTVKKVDLQWTDIVGDIVNEDCLFGHARHEVDGLWTVEGNRVVILQQDLLVRLENMTLPYLSSTPISTDSRTHWDGISETEQIVLWDAMAEASRQQFLASGELVLIAEPEHWISISKRHFSQQGLGNISKVEQIDPHGGVELLLPAALHPAIVVGRLIGCWERAEGRSAKASWSTSKNGHRVIIESRREIAE